MSKFLKKREKSWREREDEKYKIVRRKFGRNRFLGELFLRIHQSWLLVGLLLGIVVGTIVALVFRVEFFASGIWIIFVILLGIIGYFFPSKFFVGIMILAGMILASVRTAGDLEGSRIVSEVVGKEVGVVGKVIGDPDVEENTTKIQISQLKIGENEVGGTLYINISTDEKIQRGDIVEIRGEINEGFGSFSGSMYRPKLEKISRPEPQDFFLKIRDWFAEEVRKYIPEREANLGLAYLLGMKNGLDNELVDILKIVGLTHIVVASGTHLGIITGFTKKIFGKISRFAGVLFSLLLIAVFGGIVGWTASITRAAIVSGLGLIMWYVGRKFEAWRIILIAMATTLLINPMYIINLGWLLSFASFVGIMIISPEIQKYFFFEGKTSSKISGKIAEIFVTTISATIMCAPILLYFFGSLSLISPVANLLILPTVAITMGFTFFSGIFSPILPIFSVIFGKLAEVVLKYHIFLMDFFAEQKFFLIKIPAECPWVFLIYLPVVGLFLFRKLNERREEKKMGRRSPR